MQRPARVIADVSEVCVTGGTGTGNAALTAFDSALAAGGIHNANLIAVSSITPVDAERVEIHDPGEMRARISPGAMVPAVYAHAECGEPGERVHAAVAGVRLASGYGVNVEHHGTSSTRADVRDRCREMLGEMAETRDEPAVGEAWMRYEEAEVPQNGEWTSAVAALVYR